MSRNRIAIVDKNGNSVGTTDVAGTPALNVAVVSGGGAGGLGGDASSANQLTEISKLTSIDGKTPALGQAAMASSTPVVIASNQSAVPVSAASLPLPTGASTSAKQPALGTAGTASTDVITVQGIASMTPLKVDNSANVQPVSGTVSVNALPAGTNVIGHVIVDTAPSTAVTNAGTFAVQATLAAETTKVIGTVNQGTSPWVTSVGSALPAGTNLLGKVGIDQTNPGTTNKVSIGTDGTVTVNALPAGANTIGNVGLVAGSAKVGQVAIDQTTPGTTNLVQVGGTLPTGTNSIGQVTANAGTNLNTSALALDATLTGGTQQSKITDGTNIATVKAASTAAVATDKALVVAISPNNSLSLSVTDTTASGSITTQNLNPSSGAATAASTVATASLNNTSSVAIQVTGTYTGALTPQISVDGSNWIALSALTNVNTGVQSATIASASTGIWAAKIPANLKFRISANAAVTGTAVVSIQAAAAPGFITVDTPLPTGANVVGAITQSGTWTVQPGNTANTTAWLTSQEKAATATCTNVAASATSVQLLASTVGRKHATFYNDSTSNCYLKFGTTASATSFTVLMTPSSYYELPAGRIYNGKIDAIWVSAAGSMRITELT